MVARAVSNTELEDQKGELRKIVLRLMGTVAVACIFVMMRTFLFRLAADRMLARLRKRFVYLPWGEGGWLVGCMGRWPVATLIAGVSLLGGDAVVVAGPNYNQPPFDCCPLFHAGSSKRSWSRYP